jgi:hypothetical protein
MQNTLKNELALQLESAGTGGTDVAALGVESSMSPRGFSHQVSFVWIHLKRVDLFRKRVISRDVILLSEGLGDW